MTLSKTELNGLLRLVGLTNDRELNCEQCLSLVAEFAEQELAGKSISEGLKAVEHHLSICGDCQEEYETLHRALQDLHDRGDESPDSTQRQSDREPC